MDVLLPGLGLELVEFDDKLPSMRFQLEFKVEYLSSHFICFDSNLWVECSVWDNWIAQLTDLKFKKRNVATFHDMDKGFLVSVTRKSLDDFELEIDVTYREVGRPTTKVINHLNLSQDSFDKLMSSSKNFPIMW